jgi:hypothetical protein
MGVAAGEDLKCGLSGYKAQHGLKAQMCGGVLEVTWQRERKEDLRAGLLFALERYGGKKPAFVIGRNYPLTGVRSNAVVSMCDEQR